MIFRRFFKRKKKICAICRQQIKKKQKTKRCRRKHIFHREHLLEWLKVHDQCPTCKGAIEPDPGPLQGLTPEDWDRLNLTPQPQQEGLLRGALVGETRGSFREEADNRPVYRDVPIKQYGDAEDLWPDDLVPERYRRGDIFQPTKPLQTDYRHRNRVTQEQLLQILKEGYEMTTREIAEKLGYSQVPVAYKRLKRLQDLGLVERSDYKVVNGVGTRCWRLMPSALQMKLGKGGSVDVVKEARWQDPTEHNMDHVVGLVRSYDKETGVAEIQTHGIASVEVGGTDEMSEGAVDVDNPAQRLAAIADRAKAAKPGFQQYLRIEGTLYPLIEYHIGINEGKDNYYLGSRFTVPGPRKTTVTAKLFIDSDLIVNKARDQFAYNPSKIDNKNIEIIAGDHTILGGNGFVSNYHFETTVMISSKEKTTFAHVTIVFQELIYPAHTPATLQRLNEEQKQSKTISGTMELEVDEKEMAKLMPLAEAGVLTTNEIRETIKEKSVRGIRRYFNTTMIPQSSEMDRPMRIAKIEAELHRSRSQQL